MDWKILVMAGWVRLAPDFRWVENICNVFRNALVTKYVISLQAATVVYNTLGWSLEVP